MIDPVWAWQHGEADIKLHQFQLNFAFAAARWLMIKHAVSDCAQFERRGHCPYSWLAFGHGWSQSWTGRPALAHEICELPNACDGKFYSQLTPEHTWIMHRNCPCILHLSWHQILACIACMTDSHEGHPVHELDANPVH